MIIGNGSIAKSCSSFDRDDVIFFASGVSDSSCKDHDKFNREFNLILSQPRDKHLVYFSNLGVYRWNTPYINHKKFIEESIRQIFPSYTIVRIEVCEWVTTPTTILNVFRKNIKNNEEVEIRDDVRWVISFDEFEYWMKLIPIGQKSEMNITGRKMTIRQIYDNIKEGKL